MLLNSVHHVRPRRGTNLQRELREFDEFVGEFRGIGNEGDDLVVAIRTTYNIRLPLSTLEALSDFSIGQLISILRTNDKIIIRPSKGPAASPNLLGNHLKAACSHIPAGGPLY